ncbi:hypothetical protein V1477_008548 [Vespula maculifrons]|uniref:Uncharacterized protein n=1 Tax=Vespula maculifrons TaxID=7453 RepID=A0ABD2CDR5_VESMC
MGKKNHGSVYEDDTNFEFLDGGQGCGKQICISCIIILSRIKLNRSIVVVVAQAWTSTSI